MKKAFVLLTAMPPTTGHLQLIQFADLIAENGVVVILCTQPHEPLPLARVEALRSTLRHNGLRRVVVRHYAKAIEQDPNAPGFWEMWQQLMVGFGVTTDDYIVASEPYGQRLAEIMGAHFFPYDIDRDLNSVKATPIRNDPLSHFEGMVPEFQKHLRTTVTIFGAESTGKTTLSRQLARELNGLWLFEYARPYLEHTINEITVRSMKAIWKGQAALQRHAEHLPGKPFAIQDTDLFSTVGYWQFPHWREKLGKCPEALIEEAQVLASDLYILTKSNIPFEVDPLRYGGDVREGTDEYWINVLEKYELPYIILDSNDRMERLEAAKKAIQNVAEQKAKLVAYDRHGL